MAQLVRGAAEKGTAAANRLAQGLTSALTPTHAERSSKFELSSKDRQSALILSSLVYHNEANQEKLLHQLRLLTPLTGVAFPEFDSILVSKLSKLRFLVASVGNTTYIAFQGTSDWQDVLADLQIFPTSRLGGAVHKGFYKRAKEMARDPLLGLLIPPSGTGGFRQLIFCGHSLGGAVANLVLLDLLFYLREHFGDKFIGDLKNSCFSITFGTPHVCDAQLAHELHKLGLDWRFNTFVHQADPVPWLLDSIPGAVAAACTIVRQEWKSYFNFARQVLGSFFDPAKGASVFDAFARRQVQLAESAPLDAKGLINSRREIHAGLNGLVAPSESVQLFSPLGRYMHLVINQGGAWEVATLTAKEFSRLYEAQFDQVAPRLAIEHHKMYGYAAALRSLDPVVLDGRSQADADEDAAVVETAYQQQRKSFTSLCSSPRPRVDAAALTLTADGAQATIELAGKHLLFLWRSLVITPELPGCKKWTTMVVTDETVIAGSEVEEAQRANLALLVSDSNQNADGHVKLNGGDVFVRVQTAFGTAGRHVSSQQVGNDGTAGSYRDSCDTFRRVAQMVMLHTWYASTEPVSGVSEILAIFDRLSELGRDAVPEGSSHGGFVSVSRAHQGLTDEKLIHEKLVNEKLTEGTIAGSSTVSEVCPGGQLNKPVTLADPVAHAIEECKPELDRVVRILRSDFAMIASDSATVAKWAQRTLKLGRKLGLTALLKWLERYKEARLTSYVDILHVIYAGLRLPERAMGESEDQAPFKSALVPELEKMVLGKVKKLGFKAETLEFEGEFLSDMKGGLPALNSRSSDKTKADVLRRIRLLFLAERLGEYCRRTCFVGILGPQNVGKSTFIQKILTRFGVNVTMKVPKIGLKAHTTLVTTYKVHDKLVLVDFPGTDSLGTEEESAWQKFTQLPSFCVMLLRFSGDANSDEMRYYKKFKNEFQCTILVLVTRMDETLDMDPDAEEKFTAEDLEKQRQLYVTRLECESTDILFTVLREDKLTDELRALGVVGIKEAAQQLFQRACEVVDNPKVLSEFAALRLVGS